MNKEELNKAIDDRLEQLLQNYHHYKFMSRGIFGLFTTWHTGMSLGDFMQWLKSKNN